MNKLEFMDSRLRNSASLPDPIFETPPARMQSDAGGAAARRRRPYQPPRRFFQPLLQSSPSRLSIGAPVVSSGSKDSSTPLFYGGSRFVKLFVYSTRRLIAGPTPLGSRSVSSITRSVDLNRSLSMLLKFEESHRLSPSISLLFNGGSRFVRYFGSSTRRLTLDGPPSLGSRSVSLWSEDPRRLSPSISLQAQPQATTPDGLDITGIDCFSGGSRSTSDPSSIDGVVSIINSGENTLPYSDVPCFITGDCPLNSDKNAKLSSLPIKQPFSSKPRMVILWVWLCNFYESVIQLDSPPNLKHVVDDLFSVTKLQRILGGFTGTFILRSMSYLTFMKNNLSVGSLVGSLLSPYLLFIKGDEFPNLLSSSGFSYLDYESWSSTSLYVTISALSDFVVKAIPTHSSSVSNPLSSSFEELSCFVYIVVVYVLNQGGWLIPSNHCNEEV